MAFVWRQGAQQVPRLPRSAHSRLRIGAACAIFRKENRMQSAGRHQPVWAIRVRSHGNAGVGGMTKVEGQCFPMRLLCWMDEAEIPVNRSGRVESQGKRLNRGR